MRPLACLPAYLHGRPPGCLPSRMSACIPTCLGRLQCLHSHTPHWADRLSGAWDAATHTPELTATPSGAPFPPPDPSLFLRTFSPVRSLLQVDSKFFMALMPVALFHTVGHIAAVVSFSQMAVSFTHIVKSAEPVFSVALSGPLLGVGYPWWVRAGARGAARGGMLFARFSRT